MIYLGLDHHKKSTFVCAIDEQGIVLQQGRVANTREAFVHFLEGLPRPCSGVVEAGFSWSWIYQTLEELGIPMTLAHPHKLRAIAEAKIKTDRLDAAILAQLLRAQLIPAVYVPSVETRDQKRLWRERIWLVRMNTRIKNRIHRLLADYHVPVPEFTDLFGKAGRQYLESLVLPEPGLRLLKTELELLKLYQLQIQAIQKAAVEASQHHPYRAYLESLPGFGPIFASIVALEIDSIERFHTPGKLASYCGLAPSLYSSGDTVRLGNTGPSANHWLKWAFIEAAWAALRSSADFRLRYQKLRKFKKPQVAIVACARHLCMIAYQLLKEQRAYEERVAVYA